MSRSTDFNVCFVVISLMVKCQGDGMDADSSAVQNLFLLLLTVTMVIFNSLCVRCVSRVQILLTGIKLSVLAVIIITGIVQMCRGKLIQIKNQGKFLNFFCVCLR